MSDGFESLVWRRFKLGDLLGSGGTASVFEALDVRTGRQIALKVMHPHFAADPVARGAFLMEAERMLAAAGDNVVQVLEVTNPDDDMAWIAMERAAGLTLSELVADHGALSASNSLSVAEGVLRGLVTTHGAGLTHRDVGPGNVMVEVDENGEVDPSGVRLIDFGIAALDGSVADGEVRGNPSYVSPEQAAGAPVDARGDLYQLGGVLYFALTGRPPFVRDTVAAVLEAHRSSPPPVPSVSMPGLPREVDRLVARAMVKHPEGRVASATAMLEAVAAARARLTPDGRAHGVEEATTVLRTVQRGSFDGRTQVLGAVTPGRAPRPVRKARQARPIRLPSGWLAAILVAGLVSSAWILAAQGSPAPVPQASAPAETPAPAVTEKPAVRPQPAVLRVPNVEGATLEAARAALARSGLTVGELIIQDSALAGDTVLRVSPAVGSALLVGSVVELVVASGSNGVPVIIGMTEADAVAAIGAAGLVAKVRISKGESEGAPAAPGTVIECTPNERTAVRLGSEVNLVVAALIPADSSPTPSPSPSPTPYPDGPLEPSIRRVDTPST